jgi:hypothetical protein
VSSGACRGMEGSVYLGFPYAAFESAFLSLVRELQPAALTDRPQTSFQDELDTLVGRRDELATRIQTIKARMVTDPAFESLIDVLQNLEQSHKQTCQQIEKVKIQTSENGHEDLTEAQTIAGMLASCKPDDLDQLRTRLRQHIRGLVQEVWMLVRELPERNERNGRPTKECEVQIMFKSGAQHCYRVTGTKPTDGVWAPFILAHNNLKYYRHSERPELDAELLEVQRELNSELAE